ncbi:hypothetical protein DFQ28_002887 [Apophysomyces sp. BC1034]|nr:hypothetical protein DFQ30_002980 [Apophysomyces sp. BC1015]KAG0180138.1 hypothetical protein DFQ29_001200 [Apophysomyces sp. BC1021]KAG0189787.1 hypothetical protein DFQ28_002887 [Apophysomyces sp. BC1034]
MTTESLSPFIPALPLSDSDSVTSPQVTPAFDDNEKNAVTAVPHIDDSELLALLGYAFDDWDDNVPELSEEEDNVQEPQISGKRKRDNDDDDLFAQLDFVEVPLTKKQFVEDDLTLDISQWMDDEEIRLTLDLIAS